MPILVTKTDGVTQLLINDGEINNSLAVSLPGINSANFAQAFADNTVHMLENFASASPPPNAIKGQLWFNTANRVLQVWNGTDPGFGDDSAADMTKWYDVTSAVSENIVPVVSNLTIGTSAAPFGLIHSTDAKLVTVSPNTDNTGSIGTSSIRYNRSYTDVANTTGVEFQRPGVATTQQLRMSPTGSIVPMTSTFVFGDAAMPLSNIFSTSFTGNVVGTLNSISSTQLVRNDVVGQSVKDDFKVQGTLLLEKPVGSALTADVSLEVVGTSLRIQSGSKTALLDVNAFGTSSKVWHSDNDGHTSGLDADTVDGIHGTDLYTKAQVDSLLSSLKAAQYPVGSIYMNANVSTNPATLLGFGTWVRYGNGRVLVGVDEADASFNAVQETGGAKTHTLSAAEMPVHSHSAPSHYHYTVRTAGGSTASDAVSQNASPVSESNYLHFYSRDGGDNSTNARLAGSGSSASPADTGRTSTAGGGSTTNAGSSTAHNNLQPYITVYIWRRTA